MKSQTNKLRHHLQPTICLQLSLFCTTSGLSYILRVCDRHAKWRNWIIFKGFEKQLIDPDSLAAILYSCSIITCRRVFYPKLGDFQYLNMIIQAVRRLLINNTLCKSMISMSEHTWLVQFILYLDRALCIYNTVHLPSKVGISHNIQQ